MIEGDICSNATNLLTKCSRSFSWMKAEKIRKQEQYKPSNFNRRYAQVLPTALSQSIVKDIKFFQKLTNQSFRCQMIKIINYLVHFSIH